MELLPLISEKQYLLPKYLPTWAAQNRLEKEIVVLYKLKGLFKSNSIHNFKGNISLFSPLVGVSDSTLYRYISKLKQLGFLRYEGSNLCFTSNKKICRIISIRYVVRLQRKTGDVHYTHKVSIDESKFNHSYLLKTVNDENIEQQKTIFVEKTLNNVLKVDVGSEIPKSLRKDTKARILKNFDRYVDRQNNRNIESLLKGENVKINGHMANSREHYGYLTNRSKASASRVMNEWVELGYTCEQKHLIMYRTGVSYQDFVQMRLPGKFIFDAGTVFLRLPNKQVDAGEPKTVIWNWKEYQKQKNISHRGDK